MSHLICPSTGIDLFSLYVLFFHFRPRDGAPENRGSRGPVPPFFGLLNISALHVQYGIQAFAKFKRPEWTRLHPAANFYLKTLLGGARALNSPEKCAVRSPDGRYLAHIATVYYISRLPYHKILRPPLFNPGLSQFLSEISLPWNMQLGLTKYCCASYS